jgi:hypothetical protein
VRFVGGGKWQRPARRRVPGGAPRAENRETTYEDSNAAFGAHPFIGNGNDGSRNRTGSVDGHPTLDPRLNQDGFHFLGF